FGQSPATRPDSRQKEGSAAQDSRSGNPEIPASEPKPGRPENRVAADEPRPNDLHGEVETLKAENTTVREQLRRMEEQQKALLELVERLQRRLDGAATADVQPAVPPPGPPQAAEAPAPLTNEANTSAPPASAPGKQNGDDDRYRDGIIIWETKEDAKVPFLLKFNNNTQVRYLNTLASNDTFTDHLGVVREVHKRNDITVNRSMFILGGYVFDKRLRYSLTVWTSAGAASIVVAGNIGWQFNKKLTITGGYTGVPGTRSLVNTFPFFASTDRTLADNFFRPAFTQGVWANGEIAKGLHYIFFVGNGLNTLNISANKIDTKLLTSGSVWWEPLGDFGEPGKARNMYEDYFASKNVRVRLGTSFTRSPEDRFSNLDQSNPDNTSLYNSDGVLTFSTGAFAPGVTLEKATYRMWATDGGLKYNGLALNGQYFFRWLNDFKADGPLPVSSTFDHGFELSASKFVVPKKLILFARGSAVFGQFGDSHEYAGGFKWHFLPTERLWLSGELMRVWKVPYSGAFTPYTVGMTGWAPMIQTVLAF
ncbi:MAG: bZIP transcription factor, partial [Pyrinomonadaceae bacterium]